MHTCSSIEISSHLLWLYPLEIWIIINSLLCNVAVPHKDHTISILLHHGILYRFIFESHCKHSANSLNSIKSILIVFNDKECIALVTSSRSPSNPIIFITSHILVLDTNNNRTTEYRNCMIRFNLNLSVEVSTAIVHTAYLI